MGIIHRRVFRQTSFFVYTQHMYLSIVVKWHHMMPWILVHILACRIPKASPLPELSQIYCLFDHSVWNSVNVEPYANYLSRKCIWKHSLASAAIFITSISWYYRNHMTMKYDWKCLFFLWFLIMMPISPFAGIRNIDIIYMDIWTSTIFTTTLKLSSYFKIYRSLENLFAFWRFTPQRTAFSERLLNTVWVT